MWQTKNFIMIARRSCSIGHRCCSSWQFGRWFALALLLIFRFHWRDSVGASRSPPEANPRHQSLRDTGHSLLYALVILLGIVNAILRADSIFGLVSLPAAARGSAQVRAISENTHLIAAHVVVAVSGLHDLVALARHCLGGGGITRMLAARE
jgi:cytochrome b561